MHAVCCTVITSYSIHYTKLYEGKIYELQKLRCNRCQKIFTAAAPDNIGDEKYDAASGAMIALLKYGSGLPFNRLDQLQATLGVPLPSSTQWEIVESVADKIHPVYAALMRHAAGGEVVYNDDTVMKILELMKQSDEDRGGRKGMYTSGIMSTVGDRKMAVFRITSYNVCYTKLLRYGCWSPR